eukprot:COSAG01_NODE_7950_length_2978_cov_107.318166_3_plen_95_part_00
MLKLALVVAVVGSTPVLVLGSVSDDPPCRPEVQQEQQALHPLHFGSSPLLDDQQAAWPHALTLDEPNYLSITDPTKAPDPTKALSALISSSINV